MLLIREFIFRNIRKYLHASQEKYLYYEHIMLSIIRTSGLDRYTNLVPVAVEIPWKEDENYLEPIDSNILWAAPKSRRSVEKRRTRRIGSLNYVCKLIPLRKLETCNVCGHTYEIEKLCPNCYSKIKEVSDAIKEAMIKADGKKPIENEYEPKFIGEKDKFSEKFHEGKQILEVPIERPSWFAKKLTQTSNVAISSRASINIPNPTHIKIKDDS